MAMIAEIESWMKVLEEELGRVGNPEDCLKPLKQKRRVFDVRKAIREIVAGLMVLGINPDAVQNATIKLADIKTTIEDILGRKNCRIEEEICPIAEKVTSTVFKDVPEQLERAIDTFINQEKTVNSNTDEISFDDFWGLSLHEQDPKGNDNQSDTRTVELIEVQEDMNLKSKAREVLNAIFEVWRMRRDWLVDSIENGKIPQEKAESLVGVLFWGKEVEEDLIRKRKSCQKLNKRLQKGRRKRWPLKHLLRRKYSWRTILTPRSKGSRST